MYICEEVKDGIPALVSKKARMKVCLDGEQETGFRVGREMGCGLVKMSLDKSCVLGQGILFCWSVLTSMEPDLLRCFLDTRHVSPNLRGMR